MKERSDQRLLIALQLASFITHHASRPNQAHLSNQYTNRVLLVMGASHEWKRGGGPIYSRIAENITVYDMRTRLSKVSIRVDICVYLSGLVKSSESQQVVRIRNRRGNDAMVGGVILDSDWTGAGGRIRGITWRQRIETKPEGHMIA